MIGNVSGKVLARDVAIVWVLTNLGGAIVGFTGAALLGPGAIANPRVQLALTFSNLVFGILGFAVVGALKKSARFKYLFFVGMINWLLNGAALLLFPMGLTLKQWLLAPIFVLIVAAVGGGLSLLFVPDQTSASELRSN